jgi:2-polyprenyl-6-methoxyphenol hydroxylase-like FAD-dependent oxidoreductase
VVLERAPQPESVGARITLFANATNALGRLGVADAVAAAGAAARYSVILTSDGRELTTVRDELLAGAIAVHRGDLQAVASRERPVKTGAAPGTPMHVKTR